MVKACEVVGRARCSSSSRVRALSMAMAATEAKWRASSNSRRRTRGPRRAGRGQYPDQLVPREHRRTHHGFGTELRVRDLARGDRDAPRSRGSAPASRLRARSGRARRGSAAAGSPSRRRRARTSPAARRPGAPDDDVVAARGRAVSAMRASTSSSPALPEQHAEDGRQLAVPVKKVSVVWASSVARRRNHQISSLASCRANCRARSGAAIPLAGDSAAALPSTAEAGRLGRGALFRPPAVLVAAGAPGGRSLVPALIRTSSARCGRQRDGRVVDDRRRPCPPRRRWPTTPGTSCRRISSVSSWSTRQLRQG